MSRLAQLSVLALAALFALPSPARSQAAAELLQALRQGGGWIHVPVTDGTARIATDTVPTLGVALKGCVTVWDGHSGEWALEARDPVNGGRLDAVAVPGQGVPFSYQTGFRSVLDVRIRWSEPRDTTLHMWIGLDVPASSRDACAPVYPSGRP